MKTLIFYDQVSFRLRRTREIKKVVNQIITANHKLPGIINYVFVNDEKILSINQEFLHHNYYTDIITFDYCEGNVVNSEIYISMDTVKNNAKLYNTSLQKEIIRVMIHGILHLCGYDDHTEKDIQAMRFNENYWIAEYNKLMK